jgi:hypothetical protein
MLTVWLFQVLPATGEESPIHVHPFLQPEVDQKCFVLLNSRIVIVARNTSLAQEFS